MKYKYFAQNSFTLSCFLYFIFYLHVYPIYKFFGTTRFIFINTKYATRGHVTHQLTALINTNMAVLLFFFFFFEVGTMLFLD
jgi:hypothetical protein